MPERRELQRRRFFLSFLSVLRRRARDAALHSGQRRAGYASDQCDKGVRGQRALALWWSFSRGQSSFPKDRLSFAFAFAGRRSSIALLQEDRKLNDEVINFFVGVLQVTLSLSRFGILVLFDFLCLSPSVCQCLRTPCNGRFLSASYVYPSEEKYDGALKPRRVSSR